ncbi:hypothetical protein [Flavobacterium oreochromis]|uniref:Uncharacterized protein n=1 Tax=Flavobacterium columnare TaxID=996 RepID=A0A246G8W4_9FLAO|nr:hypothetical protein [Flavobacterium oreochromis]OWP75550.1 hypothetical protein BWK62_11815 [Flavobacterium oreochromis]
MKKLGLLLLSCTLFFGCSKENETPIENQQPQQTIVTFTNVELANSTKSTTYGKFFSTKIGRVIKDNEVQI